MAPYASTSALLEYASRTYGAASVLQFLVELMQGNVPLNWSFDDPCRDIRKAANLFRTLGLAPGKLVVLLVPHVPSVHFASWRAQIAGCAFPINYLLSAEHVARLL